jgi:hypothetical protein
LDGESDLRKAFVYVCIARKEEKNTESYMKFVGMLYSPVMYASVGVWITANIIQNQCRHQHAILSIKDLAPLEWICWYSESDQTSANCCSYWWYNVPVHMSL